MSSSISFVRSSSVEAERLTGLKKSARAEKISEGLLPPTISLGGRARAFLEHELNEVARARVAGKGDDEIRKIVEQLVARRADPCEFT